MEIRVLKYFLAVAREESISRAAEVLHLTQPTLSRQLTQLEEETGVQLFRRGPRKITLTAEGLLLRRRAEEILDLVDRTVEELPLQKRELEGTVTLGCGEMAGADVLARLCGSFRQEHPKVVFDLYTASADAVKEQMEHGLTDIGLLLEPVDLEKFDFIRLAVRERFVVLMRPDDPLAEKASVTKEDLKDLPLILPRRLNVQSELASWFGDSFHTLNIAYTGNLPTNKLPLVHHGFGYAVVAEGVPDLWNPAYAVVRPLEPELSVGTVLAWKRSQAAGSTVSAFLDHVRCSLGMAQPY